MKMSQAESCNSKGRNITLDFHELTMMICFPWIRVLGGIILCIFIFTEGEIYIIMSGHWISLILCLLIISINIFRSPFYLSALFPLTEFISVFLIQFWGIMNVDDESFSVCFHCETEANYDSRISTQILWLAMNVLANVFRPSVVIKGNTLTDRREMCSSTVYTNMKILNMFNW